MEWNEETRDEKSHMKKYRTKNHATKKWTVTVFVSKAQHCVCFVFIFVFRVVIGDHDVQCDMIPQIIELRYVVFVLFQ